MGERGKVAKNKVVDIDNEKELWPIMGKLFIVTKVGKLIDDI